METLIFALIASYNAHRQQEPVVAEPEEFQPFDLQALVARHWLDRLGLSSLEDRLPTALSLGQQQRVALARAFVRPATLVLLDEPFSALDAPLRRRLRGELRQLQRKIEATMVIVTHDPDEAALLGDEILVLHEGRVLQTGTTEAVFKRPASETVARLLGAENVAFGIAVDEDQIEIGNGVRLAVAGPPMMHGERVGWSVRPEDIRLGDDGCYEATIEGIASFGAMLQISIRLGDTPLCVLAQPELGSGHRALSLEHRPAADSSMESLKSLRMSPSGGKEPDRGSHFRVNTAPRNPRERALPMFLGNKARWWSKRLRTTFQSVRSARVNARKILLNKIPN